MSGNARKRLRLPARLLVLTVAASLAAFLAPSAVVDAASTAENKMRQLINQERTQRGRKALAMNDALVGIARRHSKEMAADGRIYHNPNLGTALRFSNASAWGENVGYGASVPHLHSLFMNSAPHRKNILNGSFDRVGVGIVVRDDTLYVTVVFVAVATARTAPAPTTATVESVDLAGPAPNAEAAGPAPLGDPSPSAPDPGATEEPPPAPPGVNDDVETIVDEILEQAPIDEEVPTPVP